MDEIVVIDGEIELENTLDGEVELEAITDLDPEVVLSTGGAVYPHYTGSYTVTPSGSVQTLDTSDKVMDDDVTVQAVQQGSATTPATIITANPTISVSSGGLITATVSKTQQITPTVQEGYVETGTAGNVGVSGSNTEQLSVQGAQTIHPASTDQSIASGKYLTGAQTFKAVTVSGLSADKIVQGTTVKIGDADDDDRIMSVTGTAQGGITPTGTKQISITQNGTTTEDVTNYANAEITVNVSGGGTEEPNPLNVNFYDYDGTLLYAYTKADFLALNSMPANPTHTGLTAQGWNWTLADAKAYVTKYHYLDIGQHYVTSDDKTHIYIVLDSFIPSEWKTFGIKLQTTVSGSVTINWGDGSTTTTSGTSATSYSHTYADYGAYHITLTRSSGKATLYNIDTPLTNEVSHSVREILFGSNWVLRSLSYQYRLTKVSVATDTEMGSSTTLYSCLSLKQITIPNGTTNFGSCRYNRILYLCMPKTLTSITNTYFMGNGSVKRLCIPDGTLRLYQRYLSESSLTEFVIVPDSVTTLDAQAFYSMGNAVIFYFYPTTPPTMANTNSLGISAGAKVYVPYSADHSILETYKTASNWSNYANYIEEMPQ